MALSDQQRTGAESIEHYIRNARWRLLGNTLRMSNKIPAKKAMIYYFTNHTDKKEKGYRGRQRVTLPVLINTELKHIYEKAGSINKMPSQLETHEDLIQLEDAAKGKDNWKKSILNMHALFI